MSSIQGCQQNPTQIGQAAEQGLSSSMHFTLCSCSPSALRFQHWSLDTTSVKKKSMTCYSLIYIFFIVSTQVFHCLLYRATSSTELMPMTPNPASERLIRWQQHFPAWWQCFFQWAQGSDVCQRKSDLHAWVRRWKTQISRKYLRRKNLQRVCQNSCNIIFHIKVHSW